MEGRGGEGRGGEGEIVAEISFKVNCKTEIINNIEKFS